MTKDEVIKELSENKKLLKIAHNIAGSHGLGMDLYQHLFLTLCEYDETKLLKAQEGNYAPFLCIKIMSNSFHSKSSPFAKIYRQFSFEQEIESVHLSVDPYEESENIKVLLEIDELILPIEQYITQPITQENFYKLTLLRRWADGESYQDISNQTGIPKRSIGVAIKQAINEIKENVF